MVRGMPLPFGSRAPRHIAACVALFAALCARRAAAAELPGARLEVSRAAGAETCPDEDQLAAELSGRIGPRSPSDPELLLFSVDFEGSAETYVARVRVGGRKQGERTLRAAGPTCDSLRDALVVTLLVLLDEERAAAVEAPSSTGAPTTPATAASSATPAATLTTAPAKPPGEPPTAIPAPTTARERRSPPATVWVAVGGGMTHGLPEGWSGALLFDLSVRYRAFEGSAGGVWAPSRQVSSGAEGVETTVSSPGGRVRGCYAFHPAATNGPRVLGCATAVLAALNGSATGVELQDPREKTKFWGLAGVSLEATLPLTARIDAGIALAGFASLHQQAFTLTPLQQPVYETDPVVGILALRLEARLF
jgi:hypothetical protein